MRAWAPIWLFPLGLLGMVVLLSVFSALGALLAFAWGFVLFPHGARLYLAHARARGNAGPQSGPPDVDTNYWRTTLR